MPQCRILYFRGGILEDSAELASGDLLDAAKTASSHHPDLMAEVWLDGRKAAVIRPSWRHLPQAAVRHERPIVAEQPQPRIKS
jgi:hypothetical protein